MALNRKQILSLGRSKLVPLMAKTKHAPEPVDNNPIHTRLKNRIYAIAHEFEPGFSQHFTYDNLDQVITDAVEVVQERHAYITKEYAIDMADPRNIATNLDEELITAKNNVFTWIEGKLREYIKHEIHRRKS